MLVIGILVIVGGFIGGSIDDAQGVFIGALFGYAVGQLLRGNSKHAALEKRIGSLELELDQLRDTMANDWAERHGGTTRTRTTPAITTPTEPPQTFAQPDPAPFDASRLAPAPPSATVSAASAEAYTAPPAFERRGTFDASTTRPGDDGSPANTAPSPSAPTAPGFDPLEAIRGFLFGGNTVVRVGIFILLLGVGFLVKYAADNAYLPIELRLIGAVLLGLALLVIGFRVRTERLAYAVSLQGGGIGIIYVVTFAALKIYTLIPASAAFAIFVVLGVATAVLSVVQDAIALAVLGIIGGFLAPILASTGSGDHVGLFTYYAILNAGILAIAWFKAWRVLNLVGFAFTFIIGTAWGVTSYQPEHFESAQFFLALFFVFYAAIAVIYALRRPTAQRGFIDTTLVFGLPAITFALEVGLVVHTDWGLAIASVVIAAFYVMVASLVYKADKEHGRALAEAFGAIGLTFVTMAVPFALNSSWTAAAYALEGAGLVWVGRRQNRPLAEVAGVFLQFAAGFAFDSPGSAEITQPVLDIIYPYTFLRAAGAVASAYFLRTRVSTVSKVFQGALIIWAIGWVTGGAVYDMETHSLERYGIAFLAAAIASHGLILELLGSRLRYWPARFGALALAPLAALLWCVQCIVAADNDASYSAWAGWACVIAVWLVLLRRNETTEHPRVSALAYGITPLLFSAILGLTASIAVEKVVHTGVWALSAAALSPAAIVGIFMALDVRNRWPMLTFRRAGLIGCEPVVAILAIWSFVFSFTNDGDPYPLPYVPLLTPLDLTQLFIVLAGTAWALRLRVRDRERFDVLSIPAGALLAAVLFVHLSAVCIRSVHYFADVPFDFDSLFASTVVQTSLSITWSVIALIVTALASRKKWRAIWFVGGALLALVVVKLFVVDLSSIATVARIVSFLVVGMLLLLIGWVSPVPPRAAQVTS